MATEEPATAAAAVGERVAATAAAAEAVEAKEGAEGSVADQADELAAAVKAAATLEAPVAAAVFDCAGRTCSGTPARRGWPRRGRQR